MWQELRVASVTRHTILSSPHPSSNHRGNPLLEWPHCIIFWGWGFMSPHALQGPPVSWYPQSEFNQGDADGSCTVSLLLPTVPNMFFFCSPNVLGLTTTTFLTSKILGCSTMERLMGGNDPSQPRKLNECLCCGCGPGPTWKSTSLSSLLVYCSPL